MDLAAELAQFKPDPALAAWIGKLLERTQKDALKIQALTFELAYYKRIRFANKSEQFSLEQRELFEESWNTDTGALEAEVEQLASTQQPKRERAGRQPLPDHLGNRSCVALPPASMQSCHASSIATSLRSAPVVSAVRI